MAEIYNFFGDIWDYLRETYFEVDFGYYQNFSLGNGLGLTLSQWVFAMLCGFWLASALVVYEKQYQGRVVRALIAHGACDETTSKTLEEIGIRPSGLLLRTLARRDSALRRVVRLCGAEEEAGAPRGKGMRDPLDPKTARFYIPTALQTHAEVRYASKGTGVRTLALAFIASLAAAVLVLRLLPIVLSAADSVMTWING